MMKDLTSSGEMMSLKLSKSSSSGKLISHVFGRFSSLMSEKAQENIQSNEMGGYETNVVWSEDQLKRHAAQTRKYSI